MKLRLCLEQYDYLASVGPAGFSPLVFDVEPLIIVLPNWEAQTKML